jgi:CIC family chloride channel protein
MGAMLGAALGTIYNYFWPGWTAHPGAYAMVGMAAVVAGTTSAPISAMLIIFEMTMDYKIILPLMVSVAISTLITRLYSPESIYTLKLVRRGINLRQGYERGVLDSLTVADVMKRNYVSISAGMRFRELLALMERTDEDCYPVIDEYGKFHGLVSFQNIRSLMRESAVMDLVVADEIATHNYLSVHPEETLSSAIRKFDLSDADFLPVVDAQDESKLLGVLHHRDLMISYQKQLSKIGDQL